MAQPLYDALPILISYNGALNHQLEAGSKRDELLDEAWRFGTATSHGAPALSPEAQEVIDRVRASLAAQSCQSPR